MCLIIRAEPQYNISKALMDDFAVRNDDGFGVMWIENNRIHAEKYGPDKMDQLFSVYQRLKDKEHWIHLRMRTHGDTTESMSHPYYCGYGIWLMHNGVLDTQGEDKSKSDTWYFINDILNPLFKQARNPHRLIRTKAFALLVSKFLGFNNKVVIGDRGGYLMFNTSQWHTIENELTNVKGMLVSNTYAWSSYSYGKPKNFTMYQGNKGGQQNLPLEDSTDGKKTKMKEFLFDKALKKYFFHLGRQWYIHANGIIYKRQKWHMQPRPDMDNDQFWNQFDHDLIINTSVWLAEQKINVVEGKSSIITPETTNIQSPSTQLVINWSAMNEEDIQKHIKHHPAAAAQAIHLLTHNRQ
jgi:predicted glutamine amidotransferase